MASSLVPGVVRVSSKDCKCPVDLFAEHDSRQFVGQSHGSEGKKQGGKGAIFVRPSVRWADDEDDALAAIVLLPPEPASQLFGGKLPAARVEHHEGGRCPRSLFVEHFKEHFA